MTATETELVQVQYGRLPDNTWGMRCPLGVKSGDRVLMVRKDGTSHEATVGEIVKRFPATRGRWPRPGAILAKITHSADPERKRAAKCAHCRVRIDGVQIKPSLRPDKVGCCTLCGPSWENCRRCKVPCVGYVSRAEGGVERTCPRCTAEEVFDQAFGMGERKAAERAEHVQKAFDAAAGLLDVEGGTHNTEFASDMREYGFDVGYWPAAFEYKGRVYQRCDPVYIGSGEDQELASFEYVCGVHTLNVYND